MFSMQVKKTMLILKLLWNKHISINIWKYQFTNIFTWSRWKQFLSLLPDQHQNMKYNDIYEYIWLLVISSKKIYFRSTQKSCNKVKLNNLRGQYSRAYSKTQHVFWIVIRKLVIASHSKSLPGFPKSLPGFLKSLSSFPNFCGIRSWNKKRVQKEILKILTKDR